MTHTIAEENFRDAMGALVKREYTGPKWQDATLKVSPGLHYALSTNIDPYRWGGAARVLILETAYNLIDAGLNGNAVSAWEFREAIEHDGTWERAEEVKDNTTSEELAGLMYRHGWVSPSHERNGVESMVDGFTEDLADEIAHILYEIAQEIEETCQAEAELDDEGED